MAGLSIIFKAVDEISTRFDSMVSSGNKALDTFDELGEAANSTYTIISDGAKEASNSLEKAAESTDYWTDAIGNYDKGAMEAVYTTEELVEMGYKTKDALADAAKAAEKATEEIGEYGTVSESAGSKSEEFGKKSSEAVMTLDDVLTTAGIAVALNEIGEAFHESSVKAAEFETNLAMISTVADTTVLSTDQLSAQIDKLSADTAQSVNELADSAYNAISSGIDTADAVETVGIATKLSEAGFTSVTSALSVLTTAMNAYQLQASDLKNVSDSLITAQNIGVMTIDQLSSAMGKAISTASAYSVDLYNLESGYVSLTMAGIGVDESTTYLSSMFNELGTAGSDVSDILKEKTGKTFGQLMNDGYSLSDVLDILYDSVGKNNEALMNLWGSAEAGKASNAIINQGLEKFNSNLNELQSSIGITEQAYETMTSTTEYSSKRIQNSTNNLSIAIGEDLNPVLSKLQNNIADMTDWFTEIIQKHPAVTAALTGVTLTITAITTALVGYKAAATIAALATTAWTAVLDMNPVFLAITAIAALTAGIVAFTAILGDSKTEYDTWTETTRNQYDELQKLNSEYDEAVDKYGETSEEALRLRYSLDQLNESFEANKQTVDEFTAECDALVESHNNLVSSYGESMDALYTNEIGTKALIQRLSDLSSSTEQTVGKQTEMESIINALNESIDGLNLSYSDLIINQASTVDSLKAMAKAQADQERYNEQNQTYVNLIKEEATLKEQLEAANTNAASAQERFNAAQEEYNKNYDEGVMRMTTPGYSYFSSEAKELKYAKEELESYTSAQEGLQTAFDENHAKQDEITKSWEEMSEAAKNSSDNTVSANDAVATAVSGVSDELKQLATNYDDAYDSASESIDGQIGLFDNMKTKTEQSVSDMQKALESQIEYLNKYTDNLEKASSYGLNEDLISSLSDGSAESAGELDAIITKIEELGGTTEGMSQDAKKFVDSFNSSFTKVEEAKDTFATTVAEMETDFSDNMDAIGVKMKETIDKLDMADEAATAARSTMDAYIAGIKAKTNEINSALAALKLTNSDYSISSNDTGTANSQGSGVVAHAEGGIFDTPHYGVYAEDGPEAFIPIDGSQNAINIWEDTGRMLGTLPDQEYQSPGIYIAPASEDEDVKTGTDEKVINLKIEGAGSLKIGSNMSKEDILKVLVDNVKGVLMDIVQQEILEEGDLSYEF